MDRTVLLEKHNPVLVIFPQKHEGRKRPGSWRPGRPGWGDYHPCSAEFFLDRVTHRPGPKSWSFGWRSMFRRLWRPSPRTGLDRLREMTESVPPYQTSRWELDVADLPSQNETVAWKRYRELLRETDHPYEPVVYGRYVERESGRALQYWYLYLYNDFRNNHEGDWEMVTIELSDESAPLRVAYSAHIHGFVQECHKVRKHEIDVGRPLLYVA